MAAVDHFRLVGRRAALTCSAARMLPTNHEIGLATTAAAQCCVSQPAPPSFRRWWRRQWLPAVAVAAFATGAKPWHIRVSFTACTAALVFTNV